jgi:hypothetical protein
MTKSSAYFWKAFFQAAPATNLITSDPNIAEIQGITGGILSASDYANHMYYAGPNKLTPEQERICRVILSGDKEAHAYSTLIPCSRRYFAINRSC